MANERVRIEIGFHAGQALSLMVEQTAVNRGMAEAMSGTGFDVDAVALAPGPRFIRRRRDEFSRRIAAGSPGLPCKDGRNGVT